jgi:hypothetical protein
MDKYAHPYPLEAPDDAGIVDAAVLFYEKQSIFDAMQVCWFTPTPHPDSVDVSARRQGQPYPIKDARSRNAISLLAGHPTISSLARCNQL